MPSPNILLIHTDQQRFDAVGANGNQQIHTPNIDQLASKGISFEDYYIQNPVCMPSRASYLTGQYPSQLGIFNNGVPLPEDARTLPRLLENRDYSTAQIGKLHFQPHANRDHREPYPKYGFDRIEVADAPGLYEDDYRAWVRRQAPDQVDHISVGLNPGTKVWRSLMELEDAVRHPPRDTDDVGDLDLGSDYDHQDSNDPETDLPTIDAEKPIPHPADPKLTHPAYVADHTIEFLEDHQDDTFLCVAGFWAPHVPFLVPQRFIDLYDRHELQLPEYPQEVEAARKDTKFTDDALRAMRHGYYAAVSEVDHHIGRILNRLSNLGLKDDTIVVFTSDHGEYLGEHLKFGKGFPAEDPVSHVPFIVRWPEGIENAGRKVSGFVEAVDLVPTLLDCCGVQRPRHLKGNSIKPAFEDESFEGKDSVLLEGGARSMEGRTLRTSEFRYVLTSNGEESLYDVREEFGEYHDLADDPEYRENLHEMRIELLMRMFELDTPLPRSYVY